ncbi:MAG TPA: sigma 54-interacting transcriptional regulator [bacterium]|nr:sigma 54-interacting transcriptional regulator [bacterium]HPR87042.1 sigma 54-interacting transcriptional regulator [bacterium]
MSKGRIYIVEDEAIIAMDLRDRLQAQDWEVVGLAFSAEQALPEIAALQPDLVLMDIILAGGMDGIEAAALIAARHEIPTIYITANADPATLQRAKLTEPLNYVIKPIDEKELQINLEMALYRHAAQKKIRESERWLQRLLSSIGEGVIAIDLEDRLTYVNATAASLTGYRENEVLGQPLAALLRWQEHPGAAARPVSSREFLQRELAEEGFFYLQARDGGSIAVDENVSPLLSDQGEIAGMVLTLRSQGERQAAGERGGATPDQYAALVENALEGIAIVRDRHCLYANRALTRMTGFSAEEMNGRPLAAFFLPEYRERIEQLSEMLTAGFKTPRQYEARLLSREGQIADVEITATTIPYQDGAAEMVVLRRQRAPEPATPAAPGQKTQPLRGMALVSLAGLLTYGDPAFRTIWGFARDADLLGAPLTGLWQESGEGEKMWRALQKRGRWKGEVAARLSDETIRMLRASARLLRDSAGQPIAYLLVCSDSGALQQLRASLKHEHRVGDLICTSPRMQTVLEEIRMVAGTSAPVLIQGEAGSGKALIAETIHRLSRQADAPLLTLDCAAYSERALAVELFGQAAVAATGGTAPECALQRARGGTLVLENVTALAPPLQLRLVRLLQEGLFEPEGGHTPLRAEVRIIATTSLDPRLEKSAGRLRQDLFFQLSGMVIRIPALRERPEDLKPLIAWYLPRLAEQLGMAVVEITAAAQYALRSYSWPGNVEELRSALQHALFHCQGQPIGVEHLPSTVEAAYTLGMTGTRRVGRARKLSQDAVRLAMQQAHDNKARAAEILGVSRATLYRYLEETD